MAARTIRRIYQRDSRYCARIKSANLNKKDQSPPDYHRLRRLTRASRKNHQANQPAKFTPSRPPQNRPRFAPVIQKHYRAFDATACAAPPAQALPRDFIRGQNPKSRSVPDRTACAVLPAQRRRAQPCASKSPPASAKRTSRRATATTCAALPAQALRRDFIRGQNPKSRSVPDRTACAVLPAQRRRAQPCASKSPPASTKTAGRHGTAPLALLHPRKHCRETSFAAKIQNPVGARPHRSRGLTRDQPLHPTAFALGTRLPRSEVNLRFRD